MRSTWLTLAVTVSLLAVPSARGQTCSRDERMCESNTDMDGALYGDVRNWADMIQNYIVQLARDGIMRHVTQDLLDRAKYVYLQMDGQSIVQEVKVKLDQYFTSKRHAAERIAQAAQSAYDTFYSTFYMRNLSLAWTDLTQVDVNASWYRDTDVPERGAANMNMEPRFRRYVSFTQSTVKIADEVSRSWREAIEAVYWTRDLEKVMRANHEQQAGDTKLRWQYFGSTAGVLRMYPGTAWGINFAGFQKDYDPRLRSWYIAATSGPKNVVVLLDCSKSMAGRKFQIAKNVARAVITSLTKEDYFNVICASASYWDQVGKWHMYETDALSCAAIPLVPATIAHRNEIKEKVSALNTRGTSELERGFEMAFEVLKADYRSKCQSIIIFITDGKDTDGEDVRCGPGYYTRSGYVPGPICKYNWTDVRERVEELNRQASPRARVFSYLIQDDGEEFPGSIACSNEGSFERLSNAEDIISKMHNYFDFLTANARNKVGIWTSPYIDALGLGLMVTYAVPVVSNITGKTVGVVGVDASLDEIEQIMLRYVWGGVTSFLINRKGETIYHPLLQSDGLQDDPIFVSIKQLEQNEEGYPLNFTVVFEEMTNGRTGSLQVEHARRGTWRGGGGEGVNYENLTLTYYYAALDESEFSFAFVLADTDREFRRSQEPSEDEKQRYYEHSYSNLVAQYNSSAVRLAYPSLFDEMEVTKIDEKYKPLTITYLYSSIMHAPRCHCDVQQYIYDDDLGPKTLIVHNYMNMWNVTDAGCDAGSGTSIEGRMFLRGLRADVLITQPIERFWRLRPYPWIGDVIWTYVGLRTGVFRTYPAHQSVRRYDCTTRPWYRRAAAEPTRIVISTPYLDPSGGGKVLTLSQAVFEGMTSQFDAAKCQKKPPLPGGCRCEEGTDCIIGVCYKSNAEGLWKDEKRCATERIEGVTSLDIRYDGLHDVIFRIMKASDERKSCTSKYPCPGSLPNATDCQTLCLLFDTRGNVNLDYKFREPHWSEAGKYANKRIGILQSEIMHELLFKHKLFKRSESVNFQGTCSYSSGGSKVSFNNTNVTPEDEDTYFRVKGPIPSFVNKYGCIQDVVSFEVDRNALSSTGMLIGNVSGPCMSGFYYVTPLAKTNLFLLVVENYRSKNAGPFGFNCETSKRLVAPGSFRIMNGTCEKPKIVAKLLDCPQLNNLTIKCQYQTGAVHQPILIAYLLCSLFYLCSTQLFK